MSKINLDKNQLYNLYIVQQLSTRNIAEILNVSQTTIRRQLKKYNIPLRTLIEAANTPAIKLRRSELATRYKEEYSLHRTNICQYCGKNFPVDSNTKNHKYCSIECCNLAKRKIYYCKNCGGPIAAVGHPRVYCDNCIEKYGASLWNKQQRITTECSNCHKPMEVVPSRLAKHQNCYCSKTCMAEYFHKHYTGKNSPTWRGGKSHHYIGNFYSQRNTARQRDHFTCQRCGITETEYGQQMSVHHIQLYRTFSNKFEANELDNLVCLCEPCHRWVHSNANTQHEFLK